MSKHVTIVMYHFVRDLRRSRYPAIKGLDAADFAGQLAYIQRHHTVVRMEDVIAAILDPAAGLPERALLLTFDDGYADHFSTVFPLLDQLGLQGSFFVPARAILERRVLDVNKIHFLLATVEDIQSVVRTMEAFVETKRHEHGLHTLDHYRKTYAHANRWDTTEVTYLKRMLQKGLPGTLRASITDALFRRFVTTDEAAFAEELYVTTEQLRCMYRHGMHIGGHGSDHVWLDTLDAEEQEREVRASMDVLRHIGCDLEHWAMCYPYGGYDASLLEILAAHGCRVGLTTHVSVADIDAFGPLTLPRIDANDLPRRADAVPAAWSL